jgi:hypothetical protein
VRGDCRRLLARLLARCLVSDVNTCTLLKACAKKGMKMCGCCINDLAPLPLLFFRRATKRGGWTRRRRTRAMAMATTPPPGTTSRPPRGGKSRLSYRLSGVWSGGSTHKTHTHTLHVYLDCPYFFPPLLSSRAGTACSGSPRTAPSHPRAPARGGALPLPLPPPLPLPLPLPPLRGPSPGARLLLSVGRRATHSPTHHCRRRRKRCMSCCVMSGPSSCLLQS